MKPATPRPGEDDEAPRRRPGAILPGRKPGVPVPKTVGGDRRRAGRIDVQAAIEGEDEKCPLASRLSAANGNGNAARRNSRSCAWDQVRVVRDVVFPETITVQELANRMAARVPDVIKALMRWA